MSAQPMRPAGGVAPARPAPPGARAAITAAPARRPAYLTEPARGPRPAPNPRQRTASAPPMRAPQIRAPHLRAVTTPARARSLTPFATACVTIILAALGAVLVLNTAMARGSYEVVSLRREISEFQQQRVTLLTELEAASAPAGLASAAQGLGMVRAERIGFVSLAQGAVLESSAG